MAADFLVGKWVVTDDEDYYRVGKIEALIGDAAYVTLRCEHKHPPTAKLIALTELYDRFNFFFDTEEALNLWLTWVESSGDTKVVELKKKH